MALPVDEQSLTLDEFATEAAKAGYRGLLLDEESSVPRFAVFLPPVTTKGVNGGGEASVVFGIAAVFEVSSTKDSNGDRVLSVRKTARPNLCQLPTYPTHPHINTPGLLTVSFCTGTNGELLQHSAASGNLVTILGAAILTAVNYSSRDSYRQAINVPPRQDEHSPCACNGGGKVCVGCTKTRYMVSWSGYKKVGAVVNCKNCGTVTSSTLLEIDGNYYCDECAVVINGVTYEKSQCVEAAIYGGTTTVHKSDALSCGKCAAKIVTRGYAELCPIVGCEAREKKVTLQ